MEAIERTVRLNRARRQRLDAALDGQTEAPAGTGEEESLQHDIWDAELRSYRSQRRTAESGVAEARAELAAAKALLERRIQTLDLTAEQVRGARVLAEMGAIPRNEYLQVERERLAQAGELKVQQRRVEQLTARLAGAQQVLERLDAERRLQLLGQLEETMNQAIGLEEGRRKAEHGVDSFQLRAPVDGTVQSVNLTSVGEVVAPGQEVVTIVPDEVPLVVEVQVSNRDAGFVQTGQPVEIKVDAFPFMQYGVIPGRLVSLSPDVEEGAQGQTYRAWVEPERTVLRYQGREVGVRPGMTAAVDVNTGERRIIEFFLSPLIKNLKEGLSVR
jgi:hemolysin D